MAVHCIRLLTLVLLSLVSFGLSAQNEPPVTIALEQFGLGNRFRPGDVVPVRFTVTSRMQTAVGAVLVLEIEEVTGDIVETSRPITINPGMPTRVWLYTGTLPDMRNSVNFRVRLYERDDDNNRGREIAAAIVSPAQMPRGAANEIPHEIGLIAIVGSSASLGLDQYAFAAPNTGSIAGHEITQIISGLGTSDLPDRWMGLAGVSTIFWVGQESPQGLSTDQARAIREWVYRGGHLVIVLPIAGNPWGLGETVARSALHDLLPTTPPRIDSGVSIVDLIPILTKDEEVRSTSVTVDLRVFERPDNYYRPILTLPRPDGRTVAVQRTYGHGFISIVGLDLSLGQFNGLDLSGGGLPDADLFWNPILGRRQDTPRSGDALAMQNANALRMSTRQNFNLYSGRLIRDLIVLSGSAAAGLGLAFLLFAVYWVIAGPGGFLVLKSTRRTRHAWLAFIATSLVFTLIAWVGVWLVRDSDVRIQHVTVLDIIARPADETRPSEPQLARATSWFSVYLPGYGTSRITAAGEPEWNNVLRPFAAPNVAYTRFRNVSRYEVPLDGMADYRVPVRATTREMTTSWVGVPTAEYTAMFDVIEPFAITGAGPVSQLTGKLRHQLPGELQQFKVYFVRPHRNLPPRYRAQRGAGEARVNVTFGSMTLSGAAYAGPAWAPGDVLDFSNLGANERPTPLSNYLDVEFIEPIRSRYQVGGAIESAPSMTDRRRALETLSFYQQMPPPPYYEPRQPGGTFDFNTRGVVFTRSIGRELDLSQWLNRPCVIVIGYLDNAKLPIPLSVDGSTPHSEGLTMIRWIYPLPYTAEDITVEPRSSR